MVIVYVSAHYVGAATYRVPGMVCGRGAPGGFGLLSISANFLTKTTKYGLFLAKILDFWQLFDKNERLWAQKQALF